MTSAWPPESSRRGRQRGTARLAIEQGADDGGDRAWPARLDVDDGGDGAWPARLGATGAVMGRDRQGRGATDGRWGAADGRRGMAWGRRGAADRVGRDRRGRRGRLEEGATTAGLELFIPVLQFVLQYLFGRASFRPANAIFVKLQTRFAGQVFAGSARVALS